MTQNGYDLPKKVAIVYSDVKREYFPTEAQYRTEKDALKNAKTVSKYLEKINIETSLIPGNSKLSETLRKVRPDMVLNLVDSVKGDEFLSSAIPGVLEISGVPYTGAGILGLSLCMNKFLTCEVLKQDGIPVPNYQILNNWNSPLNPNLRFPLISKLNSVHGAVEINDNAISENESHLRERAKFLINTYDQPLLIQEFIAGREITVIVLEGYKKKVYMAEKVFKDKSNKYQFLKYEDIWLSDGWSFDYFKYKDKVLAEYSKRAFDCLKMYDYGKFDVRVDESGRYYFLDSNPNTAFGPKEDSWPISTILDMYGISFNEILKRLLLNTMRDAQGKEKLPFVQSEEEN